VTTTPAHNAGALSVNIEVRHGRRSYRGSRSLARRSAAAKAPQFCDFEDPYPLQRVISDAVRIDPDACRAMLASRELTPAQRLTILVALGTGLSAASFAALRRKAERAAAEAGSIEAAIKGAGPRASTKPRGNDK
jgi:hypothetical protein